MTKITNEAEFMHAYKQAYALNEEILRIKRRPATNLYAFMVAECDWRTCEDQRNELNRSMLEYDAKVNGDRKGAWMPLYTGARFWPEDPRPQDIDIRDIAHSLSLLNRFNGHSLAGYSVAQHSVLVSKLLPRRLKLFGLLHDSGECYLGDVISPVKRLIRDLYEPLEDKVVAAVAERFAFLDVYKNEQARTLVKRADLVTLATEVRDLTTSGFVTQLLTELPLDERIELCWPADVAEETFLIVFEELTNAAGAVGRKAV